MTNSGSGDRRRKKNRTQVLMYTAFVLGAAMLLSAFVIVAANEMFALMKPDYSAVIEIPENASVGQVAGILKDAGIIKHPNLFALFVRFSTDNVRFVAGKHEPSAALDYRALVRMLTRKSSYRETVTVTIPEGYEIKQIIELLAAKGVCSREELSEVLANHEFESGFVKDLKKGEVTRLQGFLFPDTYEFYLNDDPARVVNKFLSNFEKKFTENMKQRAGQLGFSVHEIVTLASIIEKEASKQDRALISSVFHNRLKNKTYPYLESCATIQYALGERKERLTIEDTRVDSPYNTYRNKGLPPGPIANPGLDSLEAALHPEDTDYLFFALQEDGTHKFSKTYEEHIKKPNLNPTRE